MKVALVHDDLVQWGGAEKVLLALSEVYPDAPIYTSVFDSSNKYLSNNFGTRKIVTSFLQKIPLWRSLYRALLPLYPIAFEQFDFSKFDLVIHHSTRFAKSIITKPHTKHICFCATPPRFLWNFSGEKVAGITKPYLSILRFYDQISARRVDEWIAGSENARERIKRIYRKDSEVLYPFVDEHAFEGVESFDGGYFLIVARLNKYKRVDIAVDCFNKSALRLKIVGVGPELLSLMGRAKPNIEFLGNVSQGLLINLLSGCKALIIPGEEDFGMVSLEAQVLGKPAIAYGRGGSLETVIDGKTGVFFYKQNADSLKEALKKLDRLKLKPKDCFENAKRFSLANFKKRLKDLVQS